MAPITTKAATTPPTVGARLINLSFNVISRNTLFDREPAVVTCLATFLFTLDGSEERFLVVETTGVAVGLVIVIVVVVVVIVVVVVSVVVVVAAAVVAVAGIAVVVAVDVVNVVVSVGVNVDVVVVIVDVDDIAVDIKRRQRTGVNFVQVAVSQVILNITAMHYGHVSLECSTYICNQSAVCSKYRSPHTSRSGQRHLEE